MITLNFQKLNEEAILPTQAYPTDAGIDFYSISNINSSNTIVKVPTGLAWEPYFNLKYDDNTTWFLTANMKIYMQIADKSGFSTRTGLHVIGGVIDQNYRGEIVICFRNDLMNSISIKEGDKIAQGIVKIVPVVSIQEVGYVIDTDRGANGFGSTG